VLNFTTNKQSLRIPVMSCLINVPDTFISLKQWIRL